MPHQQRTLSFSEITKAISCPASWDFSYGDRLAGSSLKRRDIAPHLSDGRAWGAGVAAFHSRYAEHGMIDAVLAAHDAITVSYEDDHLKMLEAGWRTPIAERVERRNHLDQVLEDYVGLTEPFPNLTRLEGEIVVPIWSRSGRGKSNRYRFQCFIDGWTVDYLNHQWIVEFKLRTGSKGKNPSLQDHQQLQLSRQPLWYAWSLRELLRQQGRPDDIVGVMLDERLGIAPKPARIVKAKRKSDGINGMTVSHAKDQLTTEESYLEACREFGVEPEWDARQTIRDRAWQQRVPIPFRQDELDEAGLELVSAAKHIHDLDSGELYPIRNAKPANCNGCDYRKICPNPGDRLYVETQFLRRPPKRDRSHEEQLAA